jgi:tRNA threonylcarbamoyladenosine biosynthesis protein TsaE
MQWVFSLGELAQTAGEIWKWLQTQPARVIALYGEMGAGKTTFTAALLRAMGSSDVANSPTFSIISQYKTDQGTVFHMDWYRLNSEEEALDAGVEEALYSGEWCLVEWPQKAERLLPGDFLNFQVEALPDGNRSISIEIAPNL